MQLIRPAETPNWRGYHGTRDRAGPGIGAVRAFVLVAGACGCRSSSATATASGARRAPSGCTGARRGAQTAPPASTRSPSGPGSQGHGPRLKPTRGDRRHQQTRTGGRYRAARRPRLAWADGGSNRRFPSQRPALRPPRAVVAGGRGVRVCLRLPRHRGPDCPPRGRRVTPRGSIPTGNGVLRAGPGEPLAGRTALGVASRTIRPLVTFAQIADAHVTDEESPARVEMLDRLGPPFTSAFRPQEALTPFVLGRHRRHRSTGFARPR